MCPTSPRFRPTPQQTYALITVGFLSVGYALYLRYMIVENVQFGLNCDAGWPTWGCLSRKVGLASVVGSTRYVTIPATGPVKHLS